MRVVLGEWTNVDGVPVDVLGALDPGDALGQIGLMFGLSAQSLDDDHLDARLS